MKQYTGVIPVLIFTNLIFAGVTFLLPEMEQQMFHWFALYFPENDRFRYWQVATNMFMHGGFAHILFNMYALWAFGTPLEQLWGKGKFLFFYLVSGIGASIIYTLVNVFRFNNLYDEIVSKGVPDGEIRQLLQTGEYNTQLFGVVSQETIEQLYELFAIPAVGASGAIYGILVAFAILFPNAKLMLIFLPFPIAAKYFIPILLALDLFSGVTGFSVFGGGIAHFAHIGGAIIGFILMWYWKRRYEKRVVDRETF
ncbi:MAG TPA: rhomboid family intramembrane serine protease [Ohtaekwangia sp.]|nr:rhomboid family intramembrane serine protease [Ohtaekwangia sp.]